MYKSSTSMYKPLLCNIGGGTDLSPGNLHSFGCLLSSSLIITTSHSWREIEAKYDWPVVSKYDGLFQCAIEYEDVKQDVLILSTNKLIRSCEGIDSPSSYPNISSTPPLLGESVGFITRLSLRDDSGELRPTTFSESSIAMYVKGTPGHFMLSGGLFQKGSSGSPVYLPDGTLIAIIVQTTQFVTDTVHPYPAIITAPVVAPVCLYATKIEELKKKNQ